jgi:hypothetical protein
MRLSPENMDGSFRISLCKDTTANGHNTCYHRAYYLMWGIRHLPYGL